MVHNFTPDKIVNFVMHTFNSMTSFRLFRNLKFYIYLAIVRKYYLFTKSNHLLLSSVAYGMTEISSGSHMTPTEMSVVKAGSGGPREK